MTGVNINTSLGSNWNVGQTQQTTPTLDQVLGKVLYGDSQASLGGLNFTYTYLQNASAPSLPQPNANPSNQPPGSYPPPEKSPDYELAYYNKFAELLQGEASYLKLEPDQVQKIIFAHMTGAKIPFTGGYDLNGILQNIESTVAREMVASFGEDSFPSLSELSKKAKNAGDKLSNSGKAALKNLEEYVNTLPPGREKDKLKAFIQKAKSDLANVDHALSQLENSRDRYKLSDALSNLQALIDEFSGNLEKGNGLSNNPVVNLILDRGIASIKSEIDLATDTISKASKDNQLASGNWSMIQSETGQVFRRSLEAAFANTFEKALDNYIKRNHLSEDAIAKIRFAHMNPGNAYLDPDTKVAFDQINEQAVAMLSYSWGIPRGYVPRVNNFSFVAETQNAYESAFKVVLQGSNLSGLSNELGIPRETLAGFIRYLHHNPDTPKEFFGIKDQAAFDKIAAATQFLEETALQSIASKYGLPPGFALSPESGSYNSMLIGRFMQEFNQNLRNQSPPLNGQQIANVLSALADPLNPNVTAETRTLIQNIYSKSVADIQALYNLPIGWAPPIAALQGAVAPLSPALKPIAGGIDQIEDTLDIMKSVYGKSGNTELLNVLKIVADALAELKATLAILQVMDSEIASKFSEAERSAIKEQLALDLKKIEETTAKRLEQQRQQEANKIWMAVLKVFMAVLSVVLAVVSGGVGAIAVAAIFLAVTIVDAATDGKVGFGTLIDGLKEFAKICGGTEPFNTIWASLVTVVLVAATMGAGAAGATNLLVSVGVTVGIGLDMFMSSNVIGEIVSAIPGISSEAATWITLSVNIALMAVVAVVFAVLTGGLGLTGIIDKIKKMAENAAQLVKSVITSPLKQLGGIAKNLTDASTKLSSQFTNFADKLGEIGEMIQKVGLELDNYKKLLRALEEGTDEYNRVKGAVEFLEKTKKGYENQAMEMITGVMDDVHGGMNAAAHMTEAVGRIIDGAFTIRQGELSREIAGIEAEIEMIKEMIKQLRKLLDKIMEGMSGTAEWMADIANLQNKMYSDLSATATAVAGANE